MLGADWSPRVCYTNDVLLVIFTIIVFVGFTALLWCVNTPRLFASAGRWSIIRCQHRRRTVLWGTALKPTNDSTTAPYLLPEKGGPGLVHASIFIARLGNNFRVRRLPADPLGGFASRVAGRLRTSLSSRGSTFAPPPSSPSQKRAPWRKKDAISLFPPSRIVLAEAGLTTRPADTQAGSTGQYWQQLLRAKKTLLPG